MNTGISSTTSRPSAQPPKYLEEFHEIFSEAVRLRMISDVPLGAFLSGGVDSTAVVAAMARESERRVSTTTITFSDSSFNEAPYARTVAETLNTDHREVAVEAHAVDIPCPRWSGTSTSLLRTRPRCLHTM